MSNKETEELARKRAVGLLSAAALGVVVVGFFTGIQPVVVSPKQPTPENRPPTGRTAPSYSELREHGFNSSQDLYTAGFALLERALPELSEPVVQTEEQRQLALQKRASGRAFDGAPPTIPHAIDSRAVPNCLACHERGLKIADRIAPPMSHKRLDSCTQCHVPRAGGAGDSLADSTYWQENAFEPLAFGGRGERAYDGAPPTVPHPTTMRERCSSCHGVTGQFGLKSTHPVRQSCQQCHAPNAVQNQRVLFAQEFPRE